jgi:hypothetical protein
MGVDSRMAPSSAGLALSHEQGRQLTLSAQDCAIFKYVDIAVSRPTVALWPQATGGQRPRSEPPQRPSHETIEGTGSLMLMNVMPPATTKA